MFVRVIPKQLSPRRSAKRTVFVSTRLTLSQKLLGFRVGWVLQSKAASCPEFESARNGLLGPDRSPTGVDRDANNQVYNWVYFRKSSMGGVAGYCRTLIAQAPAGRRDMRFQFTRDLYRYEVDLPYR